MDDADLLGSLVRHRVQRAPAPTSPKGPDRGSPSPSTSHPDRRYGPDDPLARGEVGKVSVPVPHLGRDADPRLDRDVPSREMNTSMTIAPTAMWLLGMPLALAEGRGIDPGRLTEGAGQNDIIKGAEPRHLHLRAGAVAAAHRRPDLSHREARPIGAINVCSRTTSRRRRDRSGGRCVRDGVRCSTPSREIRGRSARGPAVVVGRMSFFVNAGIRFVEEMCKMRAMGRLWERLTAERYGVTDPQAAAVPLRQRPGQLARADTAG